MHWIADLAPKGADRCVSLSLAREIDAGSGSWLSARRAFHRYGIFCAITNLEPQFGKVSCALSNGSLLQIVTIKRKQPPKERDNEMTNEKAMEHAQYDPDNLLASLIGKLNLKNDAALSRALEVAPPVISKIRHRRLPVGASLLIRMHEVTDLSIKELRTLMGDRRNKFRISDKQFKPKIPMASTASVNG